MNPDEKPPTAAYLTHAERCIARQRDLVGRLASQTRDTRTAEELLALMIDVQTVMSRSHGLLKRLTAARDQFMSTAVDYGGDPQARTGA